MKSVFLAALFSALALSSGVAQAKRPIPATNAEQLTYFLGNEGAYKDYMLQCSGCHRFDGQGAENRGIPSFVNSIGLFSRLPEGRAYMIRVPGASQSQINNDELALVLNWIVAKYSPEEYESGSYRPFTAAEVGASRPYRFDDVAVERRKLEMLLEEKGLQPSSYLYGLAGRE